MQYEACLRAAQQLSRQLADGKQLTSVCLICLVDFVYKHDVFGHASRLREDCHELFDSCVRMFMTPRTADDLARLHRRPGNCRRHQARTDLAADDLHMIILETLELIVSYGLHSGDSAPSARALKTQKAFANSAGHWPTRLDQLLPLDATPAVAWLLHLAEKRLSSAPLAMLANCVIMARGVVLPVMLTDSNRTRLVAILCKTLCMGASARARREDPRSAAALCIDSLCHGPGFLPRDFDCLVAGHETALYEATCEAVLCAPDSLEYRLDALVECCARLHDMLGARAPRPAPERVRPLLCPRKQGIVGSVLPHGVRAALAHTLITQAAGAPRCAAPGCGLAVLQSGDCAKFQVCARCRVPRYCSRGCQARDWRGGSLPHRAVCPVLCKVPAQSHVDPADPEFARTLLKLGEGDIYILNAWLTACREEFGTASELISGSVDVRDPLRFLWRFLRHMFCTFVGSLCLVACGYRDIPLGPFLMALFCIVCFSFAD